MLLVRLFMLLIAGAIIALGLFMLQNGSQKEMLSFFIAYFSSSLVLLVSFQNYRSIVQKGIAAKSVVDNRDTIEKIDDPYELYDDASVAYDNEVSMKEIIKEEKRAFKKQKGTLKERVKNSLYAFRFSRVLSYLLLVLGFFYLIKHNALVIGYYLSALIIPITVVIIYLFGVGIKIDGEEKS